jgi:hypothetical protein
MLSKSDVAIDERSLHRRELGGSEILFSEKPIHWPGADRPEKHALRIDPTALELLRAAADEYRPRSAESNQFMRVDGQIVWSERSGILEEIARHPMIFTGGSDVFHLLAESSPQDLGSARTRRSDKSNREMLIVCHRNQRCFAVTREAFNANLPGIDGLVALKIIESTARAPSPGTQRAPVVEVARLSSVDEADDALR